MKTLKQILELYKPKSQDEDKFVKKHIVVKHKDKNGNGDDVFQATNIKPLDRKKERHGYEPGEDEKVYEEYEDDLQELDVNPKNRVKLGKILKDPERSNPTTPRGQSNLRNIAKNAEKGAADQYGKRNRADTVYRSEKHGEELGRYVKLKNKAKEKLGEEVYEETEALDEDTAENAAWRKQQKERAAKATTVGGMAVSGKPNVYKVTKLGTENPHGHKIGDEVSLKQYQKHVNDYNLTSRADLQYTPYQRKKKVAEETEALDEVDTNAAKQLHARLKDQHNKAVDSYDARSDKMNPQQKKAEQQKIDKLHDRVQRAKSYIRKEEVEYIEEKLKVSDGIGAWISDFVHSDNPKFEGFSKRKRMKMAQAAFYSAQRGD